MTTMMNSGKIALAAAILTTSVAFAAPVAAQEATLATATPLTYSVSTMSMPGDWTGFYAGGTLGFAGAGGDNVFNNDESGWDYGLQAGYLWDTGTAVLGGELQWIGTGLEDEINDIGIDGVLRAKLIAGYNAGAFMPYITGGWAQLTTNGALEDSDTGYLWGVGANYMLNDSIMIGAEYLKHTFDNYADTGENITAETLEVKASYRF